MISSDNSTADTVPDLNVLEGMLSALLELAKSEYPSLVLAMSESVKICQSRHAVHAGFNMQLQAALTSIRTGHPEDAARCIELALDIEEHWVGGVTQGFESTEELPQLAKVDAIGGSQLPQISALRLIAATLLVLPVATITLAAAAVVRALMVARWAFAYLHNRSTALFEALLREMGWSL